MLLMVARSQLWQSGIQAIQDVYETREAAEKTM